MNENAREKKKREIKKSLMRVGACFPTFMGLLKSRPCGEDSPSTGDAWAEMLIECDIEDVDNYCLDVTEGRRRIVPEGETTDQFAFYCRAYCVEMKERIERRREDYERRLRYEAYKLMKREGVEIDEREMKIGEYIKRLENE